MASLTVKSNIALEKRYMLDVIGYDKADCFICKKTSLKKDGSLCPIGHFHCTDCKFQGMYCECKIFRCPDESILCDICYQILCGNCIFVLKNTCGHVFVHKSCHQKSTKVLRCPGCLKSACDSCSDTGCDDCKQSRFKDKNEKRIIKNCGQCDTPYYETENSKNKGPCIFCKTNVCDECSVYKRKKCLCNSTYHEKCFGNAVNINRYFCSECNRLKCPECKLVNNAGNIIHLECLK